MSEKLPRQKDLKHVWPKDEHDLFCKRCGVNRRYWLISFGGPVWCRPEKINRTRET